MRFKNAFDLLKAVWFPKKSADEFREYLEEIGMEFLGQYHQPPLNAQLGDAYQDTASGQAYVCTSIKPDGSPFWVEI